MREALLNGTLSPSGNTPEQGQTLLFQRRQFLQTLGVIGVGLALAPKNLFAKSSNAGLWRDCVTGFVYTVCEENSSLAQGINTQLYKATLEYTPPASDFHSYYSAPFVFVDTPIESVEVICRNGFAVNRFPYYDTSCPCNGVSDLNAPEIRRITNRKEMEYYGCVLAPTGRRRQMEYSDHAKYLATIKNYPYNPENFDVKYMRGFTGHDGKTYPGYFITSKTQTDVNGKPLGDVLLGTTLLTA